MTTDTMQQADVLWGVPSIAEFLNVTPAAVYHMAATRKIPTFKVGRTVCARRARLLQAFDELETRSRAVNA